VVVGFEERDRVGADRYLWAAPKTRVHKPDLKLTHQCQWSSTGVGAIP
jgi:hypothetical protein